MEIAKAKGNVMEKGRENKMPNKNGHGPPDGATGFRDGRGDGKGYHVKKGEKGTGSKQGGQKGEC